MSMPLVIQERFCRQSAALIAAGFSLPDVFAYLRVSLPKYRPIWERIETDLASGIGLPEAVGHQALAPILFQQLQLAQVHGDLAKALAVAGDYLGLRVRNRQRIGQLLIYPLVLLGIACYLASGRCVWRVASLGVTTIAFSAYAVNDHGWGLSRRVANMARVASTDVGSTLATLTTITWCPWRHASVLSVSVHSRSRPLLTGRC
ncbi:Late competence protein ComGB [Lacticaseibacillus paracasei]|nr:Late competence protein ComGB [Lacticaseibacillus paracasei]